jgi:hypothetical protein
MILRAGRTARKAARTTAVTAFSVDQQRSDTLDDGKCRWAPFIFDAAAFDSPRGVDFLCNGHG